MIDLQFSEFKFTLSLALSRSLLLSLALSHSLALLRSLVLSCSLVSSRALLHSGEPSLFELINSITKRGEPLSLSPPPRGRDDILRPNETSFQLRRTHEA